MATRNIRELFLVLGGDTFLVRKLYELTKFPFTPFLGPLPVPLTTVLGAPLPFDSSKSVTRVASDAQEAMRALIRSSLENDAEAFA